VVLNDMRAVIWLICITGCHHEYGGFHDLQTRGALGVPSSGTVLSNIIAADAEVDRVGGAKLLVDTGAPVTLIAPAAFPGANLPQTARRVDSLTIGGLELVGPPVIPVTLQQASLPFTLGGILGADVFCQFPTSFNYRDQQVTLGPPAAPSDVEDELAVPFRTMGGGTIGSLRLSPTRIVLPVTLEGQAHTFMVDTGASTTILSPQLFAAVTADGRGRLDGLPVGTVAGTVNAIATRIHQLDVGGASVTDLAAMTIDGPQLDTISGEVGMVLDGLVGGTFLREFFVTVDYHQQLLKLRRYRSRDHIVDEFVRVGLQLRQDGSGFVIDTVTAGSDADKKGLAPGDEVVSIAGMRLAGMDLATASLLLTGTAGESKSLRLGITSSTSLDGQTVQVLVEDLIHY
jgi:hypothetical protein